jgi:5'-deoxynucleotidase YfbR-like HD superfamily hydrolase
MSNATLTFIRRSGQVQRYHTEHVLRRQSVGEHSYGVAWLCWYMTNGVLSAHLLMHALAHDAAEHEVGDVPAPVKRKFDLRKVYEAAEQEALLAAGIDLPQLSPQEQLILKVADACEGALYCLREVEMGNRTLLPVLGRYLEYIAPLTAQFPHDHPVQEVNVYISRECGRFHLLDGDDFK